MTIFRGERMTHSLGALLVAIVMVAAAGCRAARPAEPRAEGAPAGEPAKTVLGLQAFFDDASNAAVKPSWDLAIATPGMQCAGSEGMRPHMTFGSWRVTPQELQQAIEIAGKLQGSIPGREVALQAVVRQRRGGGTSFHYVPAEDPSLVDYHRMVHERLGYTFEPFRPIDLPGQWRPHVTMFSGSAEARERTEKAIELAKQVGQVRIASFGLVIFGPPRVLYEMQCAAGE